MKRNSYTTRQFYNAPERPVPQYLHNGPNSCSFVKISQPAGIPGINQVRNPSFERHTDGWGLSVLGTTMTRTTEESYTGAHSLRIDADPGTADYATFYGPQSSVPTVYPIVTMNQNATLYGKVYVKGNVGDRIRVRFYTDGVFAIIPPISSTVDSKMASGDWQLFEVEGRALSAAVTPVMLWIENDNGSGQNQFYVDGALMSSSNLIPFDGDTTGAVWDGAPHNATSSISDYASMGPPVNLSDLGLDIIAYEGFGVPPVDNLTTSFADRHGAHFQRQKYLPRTLTIQADVQSCDSWTDVAESRCKFIRSLFNYKFREVCRFDLMVYWTLMDDCCVPKSKTLQIPVVYEGGLEGSNTFLWSDRIAVQLSAYEDPLWQSPNLSASEDFAFTVGGGTAIRPEVEGTEAVYPIFYATAGATQVTLSRLTNDVGGVALAFREGANAHVTIPADHTLMIDTDPLSFDIVLINNTTGARQDRKYTLDYALSNLGDFHMFPGQNNLRVDTHSGGTSSFPAGSEIIAAWREKYIDSACAEVIRC